jgi:LysM repeat protein
VRPGENLTGIARRYGLSKQELLDLNGLRSLRLQEGQRLLIRTKNSP